MSFLALPGLAQILQGMQGGNPQDKNATTLRGPMSISAPPQQPTQALSQPPTNPMENSGNVLMQAAQAQMNNPMSQTIPSAPPQVTGHPLLAQILQGLGRAGQGIGYGMMTGPQQMESQQLAAQKAETMARLAQEQSWREAMAGIQQQRANTYQQQAEVAGRRADIAEERVKAYEEIGRTRNEIEASKSQWQKDIAAGKLTEAYASLNQQMTKFEQGLSQRKELFEQDLGFRQQALAVTSGIKEQLVGVAQAALSQRGTVAGAEIASKLQQLQIDHPFLSQIMGLSDVTSLVQQGQGAGIPAVPQPGAVAAPTTGTPLAPTPPVPIPARPTPQAKARAKTPAAAPKVRTYNPQTGQIE